MSFSLRKLNNAPLSQPQCRRYKKKTKNIPEASEEYLHTLSPAERVQQKRIGKAISAHLRQRTWTCRSGFIIKIKRPGIEPDPFYLQNI